MFIPLGDYHFSSTAFQHLQSALGSAGHYLPVPLPAPYIKSMDIVMYFDHLGGGVPGSLNGAPYILGRHQGRGFWYYYFVVLWYKLPVTVLLLLAATTVLYLRKCTLRQLMHHEWYLLLPALYYLVYLDFFYSTQVGIRHIMIILPLLYIFTGFLATQLRSPLSHWLAYALIGYECISVGLYFPHFLPYTNEFIPDKKMAYTKLADTNICYGEGGWYLQRYLALHPGAIYHPERITPGAIVMEINDMLDISTGTAGRYAWTLPLTPVDHIHSQYLVYQVSAAQADSLRKTRQPR
jgi:hypothetical protein